MISGNQMKLSIDPMILYSYVNMSGYDYDEDGVAQ